MTEADILRIMEGLHCSREEAIEVLQDDEAIDHGENLFELTPEQKKQVKMPEMQEVINAQNLYRENVKLTKQKEQFLRLVKPLLQSCRQLSQK